MSAAEVTCHSRTEGSNDRSTDVTGHSTQASLVALRERLLAPEVSGCARPISDIRAFDLCPRSGRSTFSLRFEVPIFWVQRRNWASMVFLSFPTFRSTGMGYL